MARKATQLTVTNEIAILTLTRPEKRNALDLVMRREIGEAVHELQGDHTVKALIITGAGGAFCAGGDLKSLSEFRRPAAANRARIRDLHAWFADLVNFEKPVIAAVDGPAFGAGFNLALAADFILATPRAQFCAVFGRIGLVPDLGGFFLLPRIVGLQRAKEIVFSARTIAADEARSLGIVYEIHSPQHLLDAAMQLAERFRAASTLAVGIAKSILNQAFHLDQRALIELEAYGQAVCLDSAYHEDAVARFLSKQPLAFDWDRLAKDAEKKGS